MKKLLDISFEEIENNPELLQENYLLTRTWGFLIIEKDNINLANEENLAHTES